MESGRDTQTLLLWSSCYHHHHHYHHLYHHLQSFQICFCNELITAWRWLHVPSLTRSLSHTLTHVQIYPVNSWHLFGYDIFIERASSSALRLCFHLSLCRSLPFSQHLSLRLSLLPHFFILCLLSSFIFLFIIIFHSFAVSNIHIMTHHQKSTCINYITNSTHTHTHQSFAVFLSGILHVWLQKGDLRNNFPTA